MSFEEWEAEKNAANASMKQGQYAEALVKYENVLSSIAAAGSGDEADTGLRNIHIACLNNASMAYLHLLQYNQCVDACTRAIALQERNLKALYVRVSFACAL